MFIVKILLSDDLSIRRLAGAIFGETVLENMVSLHDIIGFVLLLDDFLFRRIVARS